MADKIQIRAGNKEGMPALADRELAYVRDENELYIGTPDGNKAIHAELKAAVAALDKKATEQGGTIAAQGDAITAHSQILGEHGTAILENAGAIAAQYAALEGKLTASAVASQPGVAAEADLATVAAALNALIAAMKGSGVMIT